VLTMCGGWQRFCAQFDEGMNGNARAQLRDLLETQLVRTQIVQHRASLEAPRGQALALVEHVAGNLAMPAERPKVRPEDAPAARDADVPF
jgi:hypothetical protein